MAVPARSTRLRHVLAGVAAVAVGVSAVGCGGGGGSPPQGQSFVEPLAHPAPSPAQFTTGYVSLPDLDQVVPLDLATGTTGPPIGVGAHPDPIAASPDGRLVLSGSFPNHAGGHEGSITAIDTVSKRVLGRITVPGDHPSSIAFTPDGKTAWVTVWTTGTIVPIDTATLKPGTPVRVGGHPTGIEITHDGTWAVLADFGADVGWTTGAKGHTAVLVDLSARRVRARTIVGPQPCDFAIDASDSTAYVSVSGSNAVVPISLHDFRVGRSIRVGDAPEGLALSPDGATLYVTEKGAPLMSPNFGHGSLVAVDLATGKVRTVVGHLDDPWTVALTADGSAAYVTDTDARSVLAVPLPGGGAQRIALASRSHAVVLASH